MVEEQKVFYRIAEKKRDKGFTFVGRGKLPLGDRFAAVEEILERRRPEGQPGRGQLVYLVENMDFKNVGVTYDKGYVHTVLPVGKVERRDLNWTGILQLRHLPDSKKRQIHLPELSDDEVADNWWSGKASDNPKWEILAIEATVLDVEEEPVNVRPENSYDKLLKSDF